MPVDPKRRRQQTLANLSGPSPEARLRIPLILLVFVFLYGVAGYVAIEGWDVGDAFYMTLITVATVGFGEINPLSGLGRVHTSILIIGGMGTMLYTVWTGLEYIVAGNLARHLEKRRLDRSLAGLNGHIIICGYGRVGQEVAAELRREGIPLAVIDLNQASLDNALADGHLIVRGDATRDETLREAQIDRARGLVATVANDADNVYVVLSAKELNPRLFIVARSNTQEAEPKLRRAGASRVISPYVIGGRRIAMLAVRPLAVDFVDLVMHSDTMDLLIEQLVVEQGSQLDGTTVAGVRDLFGPESMVLAIEKSQHIHVNPDPSTQVVAGDGLVVVGNRQTLQQFSSGSGGRI